MTDYKEQYDRLLREKHQLLGQVQVLSDALKETQDQLRIQRTMNETLLKAREGRDDD